MSGRRARYATGNQRLDEHTSKQIGNFMFGGFVEPKFNDKNEVINYPEMVKASQDLMKSCIIQGKNHAQAIFYYSMLRDVYNSPTALSQVNILMGTSVSVKGQGRTQGTEILKGQLPKEVETLVSDL